MTSCGSSKTSTFSSNCLWRKIGYKSGVYWMQWSLRGYIDKKRDFLEVLSTSFRKCWSNGNIDYMFLYSDPLEH